MVSTKINSQVRHSVTYTHTRHIHHVGMIVMETSEWRLQCKLQCSQFYILWIVWKTLQDSVGLHLWSDPHSPICEAFSKAINVIFRDHFMLGVPHAKGGAWLGWKAQTNAPIWPHEFWDFLTKEFCKIFENS
jgi:hypothetical protein